MNLVDIKFLCFLCQCWISVQYNSCCFLQISREVLGIVPHFSLAPASSPHVSACPICPTSLPLMSQPVPFAPSHFPSCPGLPAVSSPHVPACSLCQTPCCIVSPSCIREQKFVFCQAWWYVCRHLSREQFYSLILWWDCVGDFEWHSSSPAVVFHLLVTFFAWETKVCLRFASLWSVTRSLLLNEGKSLVSPCVHCLPIQLHKVSSQVFDVTWMLLSRIA